MNGSSQLIFPLPCASRRWLPCVLAFLTFLASGASGAPVASAASHASRPQEAFVSAPEGFPFAAMNADEDFAAAGHLKSFFSWKGAEIGFPFPARIDSSVRMSGGIADRAARADSTTVPAALACTDRAAFGYFPERRSPETPRGTFESLALSFPVAGGERDFIRCAMSPMGRFAVLFAKERKVVVSDGDVFDVSNLASPGSLVATPEGFLVFDRAGNKVVGIAAHGVSTPSASAFPRLSSTSALTSNRSDVLFADDSGVLLAAHRTDAQGYPALAPARRLSVSPCHERQVCGVSLAQDGTWAVSGSWGSYLGRETAFLRLKLPQLALDTGGVAFAHAGAGKKFLYIGNVDAERGTLPALESFATGYAAERVPNNGVHARSETASPAPRRYVLWLKPGHRPGPNQRVIGNYTLGTVAPNDAAVDAPDDARAKARTHAKSAIPGTRPAAPRTGLIVVLRGRLTPQIVRMATAWEPERPLPALRPPPSPFPDPNRLNEVSSPLWWHEAVRRDQALARLEASGLKHAPVRVGIVDSGIDLSHPALSPVLASPPRDTPDNGRDDDANGLVDDAFGYDFVLERGEPEDVFGHGTHVSGIVASRSQATRDDARAGTHRGLATNAELIIARALDAQGKSNSIDLARALLYLKDQGVEVVNCSWGGGVETQVLRDAFAQLNEAGVLMVSSAGNDRLDTDRNPQVPKSFPGVVVVGAHDPAGRKASFSNFGRTSVTLFAPGVDIDSTLKGGTFGLKSGTSMAAPMVSGAASHALGILKTRFPEASPTSRTQAVRELICRSSDASVLTRDSRCGKLDLDSLTSAALEIESL